jgi:hypothetical protein
MAGGLVESERKAGTVADFIVDLFSTLDGFGTARSGTRRGRS